MIISKNVYRQLHNLMMQQQTNHTYGSYITIIIPVLCIAILLFLARQQPRIAAESIRMPSYSPSDTTSVQTTNAKHIILPNSIEDINTFVAAIRVQSNQHLAERQQKNIDPSFTPENIIPKYFNAFYGDATSLKR